MSKHMPREFGGARRLSWLDPGRLRFLRCRLGSGAGWQGIRANDCCHCAHHYRESGHTMDRRDCVRSLRRPLRPPHSSDRQHSLLLADRSSLRPRAQLQNFLSLAPALRYWHGRRVGRGRFAYLVLLMAMVNFISHGTQDMYPTYLQQQHGLNPHRVSDFTAFSMIGAILGGLAFGCFSDRRGRRRAMVTAVLLGVLVIPLWVFAPNLPLILVGGFLMQFMVQGAWGVIPAHINELSPDTLRGFFPGLAYQIGVLIAAGSPYLDARMAHHMSYGRPRGIFAVVVLLVGAVVIAFGPEAHRAQFRRSGSS